MAGQLALIYFLGLLVAITVLRSRSGIPFWYSGMPGPFWISIQWALLSSFKAFLWPIVLVWWLANERPEPRILFFEKAEAQQLMERVHLRGDIIAWLRLYGQDQANPGSAGAQQNEIVRTIPLMYEVAQVDPAGFVHRLAAVALPVDGWVVYGAHRLVGDLLGNDYTDDRYLDIFRAAMDHLPPHLRAPYEASRLTDLRFHLDLNT